MVHLSVDGGKGFCQCLCKGVFYSVSSQDAMEASCEW